MSKHLPTSHARYSDSGSKNAKARSSSHIEILRARLRRTSKEHIKGGFHMSGFRGLKAALIASTCYLAATSAMAADFNIPDGELKSTLDAYMKQAGVTIMYPEDEMRGVESRGVQGQLSSDAALSRILRGTGFGMRRMPSGVIAVVRDQSSSEEVVMEPLQLAQTSPPPRASV